MYVIHYCMYEFLESQSFSNKDWSEYLLGEDFSFEYGHHSPKTPVFGAMPARTHIYQALKRKYIKLDGSKLNGIIIISKDSVRTLEVDAEPTTQTYRVKETPKQKIEGIC